MTTTTTPTTPSPSPPGSTALKSLMGGNGVILLLVVLSWGVIAWLGRDNKQGKLARSYLAGNTEKKAAQKKGIQQIKTRKHNAVTLYVNTPKRNKKGVIVTSPKTLWLPDAQRGIAVIGAPGSGKTFSMINPLVRSVLEQGFPMILYDFKYPDQTELIAAYAAKHGYEVKVFAPGYPESEVCNLLDFLKSPDDALRAREIATVMNRNFALTANASEDKFFADAGDQLVQAILMLAKSMPQPDLMMASALLSLAELPGRIRQAWERGTTAEGWQMSHWVYLAFSQLLQLEGSEKTVAGVLGTASKVFSRFLAPELVGAFCGKTTIPLRLTGKQLLILGINREQREGVSPLVATVLHMLVTLNTFNNRPDPFVVAIDEVNSLYLPYLTRWLNENRSFGQVTILGIQNMNQLKKAYSPEISHTIVGGCATKAIFNPQEQESSRLFSDYIGEEDIQLKSKSRSSGSNGSSTSTSDQRQRRALLEPAQLNKFPEGKCVLINPGYVNQKNQETSVPLVIKIAIPKTDADIEAWSKDRWAKVRQRLITNSQQVFCSDAQSHAEIAKRTAMAEALLPVPVKEQQPTNSGNVAKAIAAVF